MQIRGRLTIQFTILVTAILLLSFSTLYILRWQSNLNEFQERLYNKALTSAILLLKIERVDSALLKTIDLSKKDLLFHENISIFNSQRKEIYTNNDSLDFSISEKIFNDILQGQTHYLSENDFDIVGLPFHYNGEKYVIIGGAVNDDGRERLASLRKLLYGISALFVAIVGWVGWIFAGKALKPIVGVMEEVNSISTVELSQRLSGGDKPDEIGKLISIFNKLLDRIENAFNLQKAFVTNVSHELKNPLTKITSQLDVTLLNERQNDEYKRTIQSVLEDIKDLNRLSASLLDLAFVNQENLTFLMTSVRVDEVLWDIRDDISKMSPYKVQINTDKMPDNDEDLYINANSQWIRTALRNVIENACKFSNDHTAVVSLSCIDKKIEIKVLDHGPGIEENEMQKIFQPFYRTNNTSKFKGHGIGLPLAQKIVAIHGGNISVSSRVNVGTEITITLKSIF